MAGNTKNLGQVSGVYIGSTPPENIIMIWYDNTPSHKVHKIYNPGLSQWVVLDQNVISSITYSELVNIATNVGLTIGQWFKVRDKSNALALAVTSTKVQYSDSLGNILIDDLGSNIQYHVSSSNLSIDDVVGVFDEVNKKLVFQFSEQVPDYTADDYILGKVKENNVWSLAKFKLSSFLSRVTGNSITWNGGFFFNFSSAITAILDKKGGVVSKDTYDIDKQNIATDIQNIGKENQTIIENANTAILNATSATAIYDKQTPAIETGGEPTDVATGDKLITIVSKFQRYINKFKFADGIKISRHFKDGTNPEYINNNDTVDSAFQKVQYWLKKFFLKDYERYNFAMKKTVIQNEDSLQRAIEKLDGNQYSDFVFEQVIQKEEDFSNISSNISRKVSRILIKKGNYNFTQQIIFDSNITLIVAEQGCTFTFVDSMGFKGSNEECFYYNLNVYVKVQNIIQQAVCFQTMNNLFNCKGFVEYNISIPIGFPHTNIISIFEQCSNLQNCSAKANGTFSAGNVSFKSYEQCSNLFQCVDLTNSLIVNNTQRYTTASGDNFFQCQMKHFLNAKRVLNCKYSQSDLSYSTYQVNDDYLLSDTPNGGFNVQI